MSIEISFYNTHAEHEGGTKHYAILLAAISVNNGGTKSALIMRMYGSIGKQSRVQITPYEQETSGVTEFRDLIKSKKRRGYVGLNSGNSGIGTISFRDLAEAEVFINIELGNWLVDITEKNATNSKLTSNSVNDWADLGREGMTDLKQALLKSVLTAAIGTNERESAYSRMTAEQAQQQKLEEINALESKREAHYGESWGAW